MYRCYGDMTSNKVYVIQELMIAQFVKISDTKKQRAESSKVYLFKVVWQVNDTFKAWPSQQSQAQQLFMVLQAQAGAPRHYVFIPLSSLGTPD
jgi:hypothetical protein